MIWTIQSRLTHPWLAERSSATKCGPYLCEMNYMMGEVHQLLTSYNSFPIQKVCHTDNNNRRRLNNHRLRGQPYQTCTTNRFDFNVQWKEIELDVHILFAIDTWFDSEIAFAISHSMWMNCNWLYWTICEWTYTTIGKIIRWGVH